MVPRTKTPAPRRRVRKQSSSFTLTPLATTVVLCAFVGLWVAGVYFGTRASLFQVVQVSVQGGTTISPMAVRSVVDEVLDGSYFGLVPHRFTYRVPFDEIEERLLEIPRLSKVRITQPSNAMLAIEFEEYQPSALWCGGDTCMFIDTEGLAFSDAPASLTGSLYPRVSIVNLSPKYNERIPENIPLSDMFTLREIFAQHKLSLVETEYIDEHDVYYHFTGGSLIKARIADGKDVVASRLEQLFATKDYASLPKDGFKSIDLRFGNRVYVKDMHAQENEGITTASTSLDEEYSQETTATSTEENTRTTIR